MNHSSHADVMPMNLPGIGREGGLRRVGSLAAHAATYLIERRRRGEIGRNHAIKAGYILRSLDASFGSRPLSQFGLRAVERWMADNPHWQPGTRHTYLGCVRVFVHWLRRRKLIARDFSADIPMPRKPKAAPRPMSRDEVLRTIEATPDTRARLVVMLCWSLGLRCVGVSNLRLEDFDFIAGAVTVREKNENERVLPVTPEVLRALNAYLADTPMTSGPLIRSRKQPWNGISPAYVSTLVSRWMRDAGVKQRARDGKGAHALRHSCLTEVARATGDAFVVQRVAGWASPATAAIYVSQVSVELVRDAMEKRGEL